MEKTATQKHHNVIFAFVMKFVLTVISVPRALYRYLGDVLFEYREAYHIRVQIRRIYQLSEGRLTHSEAVRILNSMSVEMKEQIFLISAPEERHLIQLSYFSKFIPYLECRKPWSRSL